MKHKQRRPGPKRPPAPPSERAGTRRFRTRSSAGSTLWLYGIHAVLAALANPDRPCSRLVVTSEARAALGERLEALLRARPRLGQPSILPRDRISALLPPGAVHQGIALEAGPLPPFDLADVCRAAAVRTDPLVVVLDQVEDPHNVGAILRSAAAFWALAVIVTERRAPGETGTLAKAAAGALETVPLVAVTNLARALSDLKAAGFWVLGLEGTAEQTLADTKLTGPVALVLGAEGKGLRRLTRETCDVLARLPIAPEMESLNVSVAAGVALYELRRGKVIPGPAAAGAPSAGPHRPGSL
jgi:23S rRNA (guanosine2251-2'-O)-methyltransferase